MLENTAIICNTYLDAINKVIKRPMVAIGGSYNINEFKKETAPLFKQQYLNLLIFDASVIKDDVLEALCYLKANLDSNVRIIVLYPNLDDGKIYRQILAYGIYDVIDTKIDKDSMSDEDINKLIISELSWVINEPVRFNKVKDKLKLDIPVIREIKVEDTKVSKDTNKKRLIGFFKDDDSSFKTIRSSNRYNIIGIYKESSFDEKSDDISYADIIVMDDEPSEEFVRYIKSLSEVNEKKPLIIVGIKDPNKSQYIGVDGVRCFIYDGTAEHFARQVSIVYHKKDNTPKDSNHVIYAFKSVKGGVGNTTLTVLAATTYAKKHKDNAEDEKILIIPVASNKGLCGIFNGNIIRETIRFVNDECRIQLEKGNVDILCISKKVEEALKFKKITTIGNENSLLDNLSYDNILPFAERLMSDFSNEKYDRIIFIYNQFKNAGSQIMVHEQFLPIVSEESNDDNHSTSEIEYIFQPSKEEILNSLIPKSLKLQVYKILLDSFTSEHGARMVSMTKATDNASELLKELNRSYNKARQSTITNEIIEIVSGADAL